MPVHDYKPGKERLRDEGTKGLRDCKTARLRDRETKSFFNYFYASFIN